jgi:hypothetical protein
MIVSQSTPLKSRTRKLIYHIMKTQHKTILGVIVILILLSLLFILSKSTSESKPIIQNEEYKIDSIISDPLRVDTAITLGQTDSLPVRIVSVEKNANKIVNVKYQVLTENGLLYYTNQKSKVGDTAFYMGSNGLLIGKFYFE